MSAEQEPAADLARTALFAEHLALGAKIVPFAGFSMPVQYEGLVAEHNAVRQAAGLFDVSHMGQFAIRGAAGLGLLDRLTPSAISALPPGKAQYTVLTTPDAGIVDDILVYKTSAEATLVVVNAANRAKDLDWLRRHAERQSVRVEDHTDQSALLALQGPESRAILARVATGFDPLGLKSFRLAEGRVSDRDALVARTGYTGETGFEIFVAAGDAAEVWNSILDAGRGVGLLPAGLGARDSLRLEAGLPLYGNDIDETTDVVSAGLDFIVDWDKLEFIGRERLRQIRELGPQQRRIGFEIEGRGIARSGHAVLANGVQIGVVTSGSWSPTLSKAIGMTYVPTELARAGSRVEIEVRGRALAARLAELPLYRRTKRRARG